MYNDLTQTLEAQKRAYQQKAKDIAARLIDLHKDDLSSQVSSAIDPKIQAELQALFYETWLPKAKSLSSFSERYKQYESCFRDFRELMKAMIKDQETILPEALESTSPGDGEPEANEDRYSVDSPIYRQFTQYVINVDGDREQALYNSTQSFHKVVLAMDGDTISKQQKAQIRESFTALLATQEGMRQQDLYDYIVGSFEHEASKKESSKDSMEIALQWFKSVNYRSPLLGIISNPIPFLKEAAVLLWKAIRYICLGVYAAGCYLSSYAIWRLSSKSAAHESLPVESPVDIEVTKHQEKNEDAQLVLQVLEVEQGPDRESRSTGKGKPRPLSGSVNIT